MAECAGGVSFSIVQSHTPDLLDQRHLFCDFRCLVSYWHWYVYVGFGLHSTINTVMYATE